MIKKSNWTSEEDLELLKLFRLGHTSKQIGKKLNRTKESIQKRIQKFKKEKIIFERDRLLKQIENRELKRAINSENNRYMNNRQLVKSSMSVYKNNEKGDLVLDIEKAEREGFVFAEGMPKTIENSGRKDFNKFIKTHKKTNEVFVFNKISRGNKRNKN
ncbi:hypothetical protein [Clostridium sp.]|uniref:hypothetical protein n=1 Tax=Clostridium sp. TaxID=1506 RepID=UPI0025BB2E9B|nr:hypothetical protein [Clostridium sp.]